MEPDAVGDCIFALLVENVCTIRYVERAVGLTTILENIAALPVSVMQHGDRLFIAIEFRECTVFGVSGTKIMEIPGYSYFHIFSPFCRQINDDNNCYCAKTSECMVMDAFVR